MVNAGMTASARTLGAHPVGQPMPDGQLEGHVLQPLVMGRAVSIHPLAVVLEISVGVGADPTGGRPISPSAGGVRCVSQLPMCTDVYGASWRAGQARCRVH